jgi:hypothetical protein
VLFGIRILSLQDVQFVIHFPAHLLQGHLGMEGVEIVDGHNVVESGDGEIISTFLAMDPDGPEKQIIDDTGIGFQVVLETEILPIV